MAPKLAGRKRMRVETDTDSEASTDHQDNQVSEPSTNDAGSLFGKENVRKFLGNCYGKESDFFNVLGNPAQKTAEKKGA